MIKRRWHYQCPYQLVANYGHVSYQGSWVIGSRFVLERETGKELWHRQFVRPNMLFDCTDQMLIETEWRSDSPFANGLWGIYGIDLINGRIRWVNHANGYRGKFLRLLDYIPAYTNGFRDSPKQLIGDVLVTHNNRYLDVHTGESTDKRPSISASGGKSESVIELSKCVLEEDTGQYLIAMNDSTWTFRRHDRFYDIRLENSDGVKQWRLETGHVELFFDGKFQLTGDYLVFPLSDAPITVPIHAKHPHIIQYNCGKHFIAMLNLKSGDSLLLPLPDTKPLKEVRIQDLVSIETGLELLLSSDNRMLFEYHIHHMA